ncbi:glycosyltransferase [Acidocella aminolytica]|uniref:glycosyltransferase n=1 Tax=Acidocella aminolytica TaxID=33998 RepID=UPI000917AC65|nr:glycosyltransferase [Acidocella aminolytica]SHE99497.1 hypothetical protein SAMN02746095_01798 [Acidocella aminolytica 101 = DSM 11237]
MPRSGKRFETGWTRLLVIKLQGARGYPREAARQEPEAGLNIKIFNNVWVSAQMAGLMAPADILLSLHRAEEFWLVLAEAMLRGKPVVATWRSGGLAFVDASSAALVGYRLVLVMDEAPFTRPCRGLNGRTRISHAAEWLARLGDDKALRAELGGRPYSCIGSLRRRNHARCIGREQHRARLKPSG